jgi:hypothetical protein
VERAEGAEASIHVFSKKAHIQDDAMGHTSAHGILTLVSSCVQRRLGAELSTPSVDRRTTVGARKASFGCVIIGVEGSGEGE